MTSNWIRIPLLFWVLTTLGAGCTQIYDAEVEITEDLLVVNALLTDQLSSQEVRLYNTDAYAQSIEQEPEENAVVYIEDSGGTRFYFTENEPGVYVHDSLDAHQGEIYTLHIALSGGAQYQSLPQKLTPAAALDNLYADFTMESIDFHDHNNEIVLEEAEGFTIFSDLNFQSASSEHIRFDSEVMFQYQMVIPVELCPVYIPEDPLFCTIYTPQDPPRLYCRTKIPLHDVPDLAEPDFQNANPDFLQHQLGFIPFSRKYYPLSFSGRVDRRILLISQFSITTEAFLFYKQMREQLFAENALFDPVATQIRGNIFCTSDPDRIALGLFEVAGKSSQSFVMGYEPLTSEDTYVREIPDLSFLPRHQCFLEIIPPHWIYD